MRDIQPFRNRAPRLRRKSMTSPCILFAMILAFAASMIWTLNEFVRLEPSSLLTSDSGKISALGAQSDTSSVAGADIVESACLYTSWQGHIPPLITYDDNPSVRRRYDTLPRITTTDPLPFTDIVLRSSFKAGSSFMSGIIKALYEGNVTRQHWLNETRKRHPRYGHPGPWRAVAFLRDPIDRFLSMYSQMLQFSNRKYHWYGDGDADWLGLPEGVDRARSFVASVKRRFYNEHLLPQLWFLADSPDRAPNLTFVGTLLDDWDAMVASLGVPDDVARDAHAFLHDQSKQPDHSRNINKNSLAKNSIRRVLYEEPDANATLSDVCNMYRPDFACFETWLTPPSICEDAWRMD